MKLNPNHHNPELAEQIEEYYQNDCDHDMYDYDSMWGCDSTYIEEDWIYYHWLTSLDKVVVGNNKITEMDGYMVYQEGDEIVEYEIYSHSSTNKTVSFFGAILTAEKETTNPSTKLKRMCRIMTDRYPEIYIRLLGVI